MAYSVQAIKYGWTALAGIVLTGATIYVVSNTRHHATQRDVVPIALGTHERCLTTQLTTNPTYSVAPPSFVRTWTSNVYTSNGVTVYTQKVTNTIGFYVDREMLVSLDTTIKQLVPYFVDTNTMQAMTVTGLWATLGIGDHTNKFTSVPARGTNPATYGDYPQQIYVEDLQERYKVLNACRFTLVGSPSAVNGSTGVRGVNQYANVYDLDGYSYSNKTTGGIEIGYYPNDEAIILGLTPDYTLFGNTNYVDMRTGSLYAPSWIQVKQIEEASWYYWTTNKLPYYPVYSNYYSVVTNETSTDVGSGIQVQKIVSGYDGSGNIWWRYALSAIKRYATWRWLDANYEGLTNTFVVFAKPHISLYGDIFDTEIVTNDSWINPRSWVTNMVGEFEEMTVMTVSKYYQIDNQFIRKNGNYYEIEFGSDEFSPLRTAGTFPANWCDEPTSGASITNNEGSVGCSAGCWLKAADAYGLKDWKFSYCTNKFW